MDLNKVLSEDDIKFLKELAKEMKSQNRRCTADPFYFVLMKKKRIVGLAPGYGDGDVLIDSQDDWQEYSSREEAVKSVIESHEIDEVAAEEYVDKNFEWFGVKEEDEPTNNFFLTLNGLKEHIRLNGHNLGLFSSEEREDFKDSKELYSYVMHAFRNPEVAKLFEIIKKFAEE